MGFSCEYQIWHGRVGFEEGEIHDSVEIFGELGLKERGDGTKIFLKTSKLEV